jgi:hypothetical protein
MNYSLHEDEYEKLASVSRQLGMVIGLLAAAGETNSVDTYVDVPGLCDFLEAQRNMLRNIQGELDERRGREKTNDKMIWVDWLHLIKVVTGESINTPSGSELRIKERLQATALMDADYTAVLDAYQRALTKQPFGDAAAASPVVEKQAPKRQRARLTKTTGGDGARCATVSYLPSCASKTARAEMPGTV